MPFNDDLDQQLLSICSDLSGACDTVLREYTEHLNRETSDKVYWKKRFGELTLAKDFAVRLYCFYSDSTKSIEDILTIAKDRVKEPMVPAEESTEESE